MAKEFKTFTICELLTILYRSAVASDRVGEADIIKDCYIAAKKMNKRLVEYKFKSGVREPIGNLVEEWETELKTACKRDYPFKESLYISIVNKYTKPVKRNWYENLLCLWTRL